MVEGYGYGSIHGEDVLSKLRAERFRHLEGQIYLDHAGATLYGSHQVEQHAKLLTQNVYGNPHSSSAPSSQRTSEAIESVRRDVAEFFNTSLEEYDVVFTSGATAGLKLIGESFPFTSQSSFAYSVDAHNSVLGIRSFANARGASMFALPMELLDTIGQAASQSLALDEGSEPSEVCNLVAFPGECNFSGAKHPLSIVDALHQNALNGINLDTWRVASSAPSVHHPRGKWFVLLDAAKMAGTNPIDLGQYKPDFMVVSFYKLFGYPSGVGALLIKKSIAHHLTRPFHGGGTLATSFSVMNISRPHAETHRRFEDGTVPYLSILACKVGLETLRQLTMPAIQRHVAALTTYTYKALSTLRHANGARVCQIYGSHHVSPKGEAGSIVACNFKRPDGAYVGYTEFSALASLHNIHIRTGCFCNPGACQFYLGLTTNDLLSHVDQGHVCGDAMDVINDRPTGAVRLSFGYMTTKHDIDTFLAFVATYFVSAPPPAPGAPPIPSESAAIQLSKITLFPIKSCGGMVVSEWTVGSRGLQFDREWALVDPGTMKALSQKDLPKMATIHPVVDLQAQVLNVTASGDSGCSPLSIPLNYVPAATTNLSVCAAKCQGSKYDELVNAWFTRVLGRPCSLVRASKEGRRGGGRSSTAKTDHVIGFANEAPFLVISRDSVTLMNEKFGTDISEDAFRANLIVDGCDAHAEDRWSELAIRSHAFSVVGPCGRCTMVNVDQTTGTAAAGPLKHLATYRRSQGKIFFGQFLSLKAPAAAPFRIRVGDAITTVSSKPDGNLE